MRFVYLLMAAILSPPATSWSLTIPVPLSGSIQTAIEAAADGDVVSLGAGTYAEDIDFSGKAIAVVGVGAETVIRGTGNGPVVTFRSGETHASVLDSVSVTGGVAPQGGGIYVSDSHPTILRTTIVDNRAHQQGSGIFLRRSQAQIFNNLFIFNRHESSGDPHSVEIVDASPTIINNTIARGDSNGLIVRGISAPLIMNNIFALNGSSVDGGRRGRGICDFSGGAARIHYNLFYKNRVGALLTSGTDFRRIKGAERQIGIPRLEGNVDGSPKFQRRVPNATAEARWTDFTLRDRGRARAVDAGNPDPTFADVDGTRNDLGFTGGPFAAPTPN